MSVCRLREKWRSVGRGFKKRNDREINRVAGTERKRERQREEKREKIASFCLDELRGEW